MTERSSVVTSQTYEVPEGDVLVDAVAFDDDSLGKGDDLPTPQGLLEPNGHLIVAHVNPGVAQDHRSPLGKEARLLLSTYVEALRRAANRY